MTALTQDRNTQRRYVERYLCENAAIAANTTVWNGSIAAQDSSGNLRPAADVAGLIVVGRAERRLINPTGTAATVFPPTKVAAGVFKFATSGTNAITAADIGKNCFALDDQTVVRQAGTSNAVLVGVVESIDPDGGIWVKVNC